MTIREKNELVSFEKTRSGFEAVYTDDTILPDESHADEFLEYGRDEDGNVYTIYSSWGYACTNEESWSDEIRYINSLSQALPGLPFRLRMNCSGPVTKVTDGKYTFRSSPVWVLADRNRQLY